MIHDIMTSSSALYHVADQHSFHLFALHDCKWNTGIKRNKGIHHSIIGGGGGGGVITAPLYS